MPVNEQYAPITAVGSGLSGQEISIPDIWFEQSDVLVTVEGVNTAWNRSAGGVTLAVTAASNSAIVASRETSLVQQKDFLASGRLPGEEVAEGLDRAILIAQENDDALSRSIKSSPGVTPPSGSLNQEANTTLGQDENGDLINRTAAEEASFLNITPQVEAAAASAAAALVSENNADTSETNAATSAGEASASAASSAVSAAASSAIPESIYLFSSLNVAGYVSGDSFTVDGREIFVSSQPVAGVPISDQLLFTSAPSATTLLDVLYRFFAGLTQITPQLSSGYAVLGDSNYVARKRGTAVVVTNAAEQVSVSDDASGFSWDEDVLGVIDNSLFLTTSPQTLTQTQQEQALSNLKIYANLYVAAVPDNADGADGDVKIIKSTGAIYEKVSGVWTQVAGTALKDVLITAALPSSGFGVDGDIGLLVTNGIFQGVLEKDSGTWGQVASVVTKKPTDEGVVSLVDHFIGGESLTGGSGIVGQLNWSFISTVGTGQVLPVGAAYDTPHVGVLRILPDNSVGAVSTISMFSSNSTNAMNLAKFLVSENFRVSYTFQTDHVNLDCWLGFSLLPEAADTDPSARFVGIRALAADTNFQFISGEDPTEVVVDSTIATDSAWHTFVITYDADSEDWFMQLDDNTPIQVDVGMSSGKSLTPAVWVKNVGGGFHDLFLDTFKFYGEYP